MRCWARRSAGGQRRDADARWRSTRCSPGSYQPRTRMDQEALAELAASIKAQGVMQPILVRPVGAGRYEIIAGERRWRAARMAGLRACRCWCARCPTQRAGHGADREHPARRPQSARGSAGIQRLIDEFGMTHEQAADAVGRSRSGHHQPAAPAGAGAAGAGDADARASSTWATRARCSRCRRAADRARATEAAAKRLSVRAGRSAGGAACARRAAPGARATTDRDVARLEEELSRAARHHGEDPGRRETGQRQAGRSITRASTSSTSC